MDFSELEYHNPMNSASTKLFSDAMKEQQHEMELFDSVSDLNETYIDEVSRYPRGNNIEVWFHKIHNNNDNNGLLDNPIIHNISLVVELPTLLADLSVEDKLLLFTAKYSLMLTRCSQNLLLHIFSEMCKGNMVDESSSTVIIPLYSFNNGLNLHDTKINSDSCLIVSNKLLGYKFSLRVNWRKSNKAPSFTCKKTIGLEGMIRSIHDLNKRGSYIFASSFAIIKYILIYFYPMDTSNYWDLNENYPIVTKATIESDNQTILEFENEDLLDFEIFGINIYLLPLSKEVSSWESIHEVSKNDGLGLTSCGLNTSLHHNIRIKLEIENQPSTPYCVVFSPVGLNVMTQRNDGMIFIDPLR